MRTLVMVTTVLLAVSSAGAMLNYDMSTVSPNVALPSGPQYSFDVGTFEVTMAQYVTFLNDAYNNLNNERGYYMHFQLETPNGGINASNYGDVYNNDQQQGEATSVGDPRKTNQKQKMFEMARANQYAAMVVFDDFEPNPYSVVPGFENRPAHGVTGAGMKKFANWLTIENGYGVDERCYVESTNAEQWAPVVADASWYQPIHANLTDSQRQAWLVKTGYRLMMAGGPANGYQTESAYNEFMLAYQIDNSDTTRVWGFGRSSASGDDWNYAGSGDPYDQTGGDGSRLTLVGYYDGNDPNGITNDTNNKWGLYDMSGNLWETVEERFGNGVGQVALGGGHWGGAGDSYGSGFFRYDMSLPGQSNNTFGIRLVQVTTGCVGSPPTITTIVPDNGTTSGGTTVTINGTNLDGSLVQFDGLDAANYDYSVAPTQITCQTPQVLAAGAVDVTVATCAGSDTAVNGYTYTIPPPDPPIAITMVPVTPHAALPDGPQYNFDISQYEITMSQYVEFLNDAYNNLNNEHGYYMHFNLSPGNGGLSAANYGDVYNNDQQVGEATIGGDPRKTQQNQKMLEMARTNQYATMVVFDHLEADPYTVQPGFENRPAHGVTGAGMKKYCNWLTIEDGYGLDQRCYIESTNAEQWAPTAAAASWYQANGNQNMNDDDRQRWLAYQGYRLVMAGGPANDYQTESAYNEFMLAYQIDNSDTTRVWGFGRSTSSGAEWNYSGSGDPFEDPGSRLTPVGYYDGTNGTNDTHTKWGLYDMSGNLWELTEERFGNSPGMVGLGGGHWGFASDSYGSGFFRYNYDEPGKNDNTFAIRPVRVTGCPGVAPTITSVVPDNGTMSGGTTVTLTGTNLYGVRVQFGGADAIDYDYTVEPNQIITCRTPLTFNSGDVDVTVTTCIGSDTLVDGFTYNAPPPIEVTMVNVPAGGQPGGPAYGFQMSQYEITNYQIVQFLNNAYNNPDNGRGSYMIFDDGGLGGKPDAQPGDIYCGKVEQGQKTSEGYADDRLNQANQMMFDMALANKFSTTITFDDQTGTYTAESGTANFPALGVSVCGAKKYCNWLTMDAGYGPANRCYIESQNADRWAPASVNIDNWYAEPSLIKQNMTDPERLALVSNYWGYRLPMNTSGTAAGAYNEFYKAASWDGAVNRTYGFGRNSMGSADGNYNGSGDLWEASSRVTPVGWYDGINAGTAANDNFYDIYDLSGNVKESCEEWFDPGTTDQSSLQVAGSWDFPSSACEIQDTSNRAAGVPADEAGFHPVRSLVCGSVNAPTISNVAADNGSSAGGTTVTVTGTDLIAGTQVLFDGLYGVNYDYSGAPGSVTSDTPAHSPATVDVDVVACAGRDTLVAGFIYFPICGDWGYYDQDLDQSCYVTLNDYRLFSGTWLDCTDPMGADCLSQDAFRPSVNYLATEDTGSITVDGNLGDWAGAQWQPLDQTFFGTPGVGLVGQYAAAWNDTSDTIYLAVQVTDLDALTNLSDTFVAWDEHDGIEVYIQGNLTGPTAYSGLGNYAQQYLTGKRIAAGAWTETGAHTSAQAGLTTAATRSGTTLSYELELTPWAFLDTPGGVLSVQSSLAAGKMIGLDVVVSDKNGPNPEDFGMISSNLSPDKATDARTFALLTCMQNGMPTPPCTGLWGYHLTDWDLDCLVDLFDFTIFEANWMNCSDPQGVGCDDLN